MRIGKCFCRWRPKNSGARARDALRFWRVESDWRVARSPAIQEPLIPEICSDLTNCNLDLAPRTRIRISPSEEPVSGANPPGGWEFHCTIGVQTTADFEVSSTGILTYLHQDGTLECRAILRHETTGFCSRAPLGNLILLRVPARLGTRGRLGRSPLSLNLDVFPCLGYSHMGISSQLIQSYFQELNKSA